MKEFCIRFYCDGEIVHKKTKVRLKAYGLKGEYKQGFIRSIKYKELDNGKIGFEAKSGRKETLHGHGYVLELSNGTNK